MFRVINEDAEDGFNQFVIQNPSCEGQYEMLFYANHDEVSIWGNGTSDMTTQLTAQVLNARMQHGFPGPRDISIR